MSKGLSVWLGPELYWLVMYGVSRVLALINQNPTESSNDRMLSVVCWMWPLATVLLSFWLFFQVLPQDGSRLWMWGRLFLATVVGLGFSLAYLIETVDYGDTRNSGAAWGLLIGMLVGLGIFALITLALVWRWLVRWWNS